MLSVEPRSENDPDLLLVITYKNWAALDGSIAKGDAISKQVEGSLEASAHAFADRDKIRRPAPRRGFAAGRKPGRWRGRS